MKGFKTRNFWFLVLNIGICISFGYFTIYSPFTSSSVAYVENFAEKGTESDEKSSENFKQFYLHESQLELPVNLYTGFTTDIITIEFMSPTFWPSPSTPPPNLS